MTRTHLDERFPGRDLDRSVWFPYYLPHWSSRAESAATCEVRDGELHLTIPPDQPLPVRPLRRGPAPGRADGLDRRCRRARLRQSPAYPVQLMIGVFDFPAKATGADEPVPELVVSHVNGRP